MLQSPSFHVAKKYFNTFVAYTINEFTYYGYFGWAQAKILPICNLPIGVKVQVANLVNPQGRQGKHMHMN